MLELNVIKIDTKGILCAIFVNTGGRCWANFPRFIGNVTSRANHVIIFNIYHVKSKITHFFLTKNKKIILFVHLTFYIIFKEIINELKL